MNLNGLSNYQLTLLLSNRNLKCIWKSLDAEIDSRELDALQIKCITNQLELDHKELIDRADLELNLKKKLLVILFPPIMLIYGFLAAKELGKGYRKKHLDYWKCMRLNCVIYSVLLLVFSVFYCRVIL